jgi:hypothetical protein
LGFAMFRSLILVLAFSAIFAKEVTMLTIDQLNAGRKGPPYDSTAIIFNLADDAKLIDVMKKAQNQGIFSLVLLLNTIVMHLMKINQIS